MSELYGQIDLNELTREQGTGHREQETGIAEGYDAEGRLLDYVGDTAASGTSSDPAEGGATYPMGEGFGEQADRLRTLVAEVHVIETQVRGIALSAAIEIGKRLMEAKGLVPHGRWQEWLAANLDYSERRAQDLMRLSEQYGRGSIPESVTALDYSKAVALLGAPEEAREALAARALHEDMSVRELQAEVKRLKEAAQADQVTMEELERQRQEEAETARLAIERMGQDVDAMRGTAEAANRTAEALRQEKVAAKKEADLAKQRARDATERANITQKQLTEVQERIEALEAREPERVEVIPPEVEAELERLRNQASAAPRGEAVVRFRLALENLTAEFNRVRAITDEIAAEDAERGVKSKKAVKTLCEKMIGMLGVG